MKKILISLLFLGVAMGQTSVTYIQSIDILATTPPLPPVVPFLIIAAGTNIVWSATSATFTNSRFCFQLSDATLPSGVTVLNAEFHENDHRFHLKSISDVTLGDHDRSVATLALLILRRGDRFRQEKSFVPSE